MKIHYISCHSVLEFDEVSLFTEMGHEVFSNGAYLDPKGHISLPRPGIEGAKYYPEYVDIARRIPKTELPPELIEPFDVIFIMDGFYNPQLLELNWEKMKHKKVVLRTIGQSLPDKERVFKKYKDLGMKIVRYSPAETTIKNYAGVNALIRFYKDPQEFRNWNGLDSKMINFTQTLKGRRDFCGHDFLMNVGPGFPFKVYGNGNEDLGEYNGGDIPYELMKGQMRDARIFIYGGTWPASYTLSFIEAWMTGMPVVAIGRDLWGHKNHQDTKELYEVPKLISNGDDGFICNSVDKAKEVVRRLFDDFDYAKNIGRLGRESAIKYFSKEKIKEEWKQFFESL